VAQTAGEPLPVESAARARQDNGDTRIEWFERSAGRLVRSVRRRDGTVTETDFGPAPKRDTRLADLADQRFLRLRVRPAVPTGSAPAVTVVDLFCGAGALTLGALEAARAVGRPATIVLAADDQPSPLAVYGMSLGAEAVTRQVDLAEVLDGELGSPETTSERAFLRGCPMRADVLLAGPPCQGHSTLNNHTRHNDDRNDLYLRAVRFVELRRPRMCLIENVVPVLRDQRRSVDRAIEHLGRLGYHVDSGTVALASLGVPQRRRRHVVVGSAIGEPRLAVEEVVNTHAVHDSLHRSVGWAMGDLEQLEQRTGIDLPSRPSPENAERLRLLHENGWTDLPNEYRPNCHREPKPDKDGVLREHTYKSMYGRLDWDKPAQTVTSGYGSMGQGRYVHPRQVRTITPHEAARLQLFPDFFRLDAVAQRERWAQMIGNAAPMKLSYVFALELLR
jgi:DNA (cytosine-5)-methyltransferase 1